MISELKGILSRSWRSHFWTNLASVTVLTLSFSLVLGSILAVQNLAHVLSVWGDEIQITIYLLDTITPEQKTVVEAQFNKDKGVEEARFVDKNQAKIAFQKSLKAYGQQFLKSFDGESENPFPASYTLALAKDYKAPDKMEALAQKFLKLPGVEDVSFGQEWVKNYTLFFKATKIIAIIGIAVILLACLFTISNSIRASLGVRREEIEILELVGATPYYIRKPFIIEGAFHSFLSSLISLFILSALYRLIYERLEGLLGGATLANSMGFFGASEIIFALISGFLIGAVGSYICLIQINNGWLARREKMAVP